MKNIPDHLRQHSSTSFHDVIPINNRFLAISGSQHTCWRGAKALQCVRSRRSAQRTQWVNRMAQLWTEVATALQSPDKAAGNPAVSRLGNPEHIRIPVRLRRPSRHEPLNLLIYSTGPEAISIFEPDLVVLQNRTQPHMKEPLPFLEREMGKEDDDCCLGNTQATSTNQRRRSAPALDKHTSCLPLSDQPLKPSSSLATSPPASAKRRIASSPSASNSNSNGAGGRSLLRGLTLRKDAYRSRTLTICALFNRATLFLFHLENTRNRSRTRRTTCPSPKWTQLPPLASDATASNDPRVRCSLPLPRQPKSPSNQAAISPAPDP